MASIIQSSKISFIKKKKYHAEPLRSFFKAPQRKGTIMKLRIMSPKKPNSAKRKIARIKLSNFYWVTSKIKGQGHSLQAHSEVLACGGRANDLPGVRYNMIKGGKYGFPSKETIFRIKSRSKYGIRIDDFIWTLKEIHSKQLEEEEEQEQNEKE